MKYNKNMPRNMKRIPREFVTSIYVLQEILKEVLQA